MFKIISKDDFVMSSVSDCFTCTFFLMHDNYCFPDDQWTDFALNVLAAWCEYVVRLLRRRSKHCLLDFYDGSYHIDISVDKNMMANLQFVKEGIKQSMNQAVHSFTMPLIDFAKEILSALYELQSHLRSSNRDILYLEKCGKLIDKMGKALGEK